MTLRYGDIEDGLMQGLAQPEKNRAFIRSRVQHLQNSGMVQRGSKGRGYKAEYADDDLLVLIASLALAELQWPAKTAARFVMENWHVFANCLEAIDAQGRDRRLILVSRSQNNQEVIARCVSHDHAVTTILDATDADLPVHTIIDFCAIARKGLGKVDGIQN